ncbi:hypothetical protein SDC9_206172 [bioreactor metagenome]|uniref:Uncharacterized protein n=1 Tax=bioreactor metagenome TaxID=1076179 RepID=A0A645J4Z9_9ZZZZ
MEFDSEQIGDLLMTQRDLFRLNRRRAGINNAVGESASGCLQDEFCRAAACGLTDSDVAATFVAV